MLYYHGHQISDSYGVYVYKDLKMNVDALQYVCVHSWGSDGSLCSLCSFPSTAAFPASCHQCLVSPLLTVCTASNVGILKQGAGWLTWQHRFTLVYRLTCGARQRMQPSSIHWQVPVWTWIPASLVIFICCTSWASRLELQLSQFSFTGEVYHLHWGS